MANKTGKSLKNLLMALGAGSLIGYFISQENRAMVRDKILKFHQSIVGFIPWEKEDPDRFPEIPEDFIDKVME